MLLRDFGKARQEQFLREAELNRALSSRTVRHQRENQSRFLKAWNHLKAKMGKFLIGLGQHLDTETGL